MYPIIHIIFAPNCISSLNLPTLNLLQQQTYFEDNITPTRLNLFIHIMRKYFSIFISGMYQLHLPWYGIFSAQNIHYIAIIIFILKYNIQLKCLCLSRHKGSRNKFIVTWYTIHLLILNQNHYFFTTSINIPLLHEHYHRQESVC